MSEQAIEIDLGNPETGSFEAYVFFRLFDGDGGNASGRRRKPEFIDRKPVCAAFAEDAITLELFNCGQMVSDMVCVDYELVFCTRASHLPHEGFTVTHADEVESGVVDRLATTTFVPAGGASFIQIPLGPLPPRLKNIYLRACVSTLWEECPPRDQWDFARQSKVTEFHHKVA